MLKWLRELAATVVTFDRSALEPGFALRCTIGVAIPLVVATAFGRPELGVAAAIGAFITGFTSLQGVYRTRLMAVLLAASGMAATSFLGALAAHSTAAAIAATALAGYTFGVVGQLGPTAATVSLNSFVAFVLFSSQALAPVAAAQQSILVLGGGLVQALLVLAAWPIERRSAERVALADVYRKLAEYARGVSRDTRALPPITPLATARQVLADPQPFARSGEMARLNRLLEDSEVIRKRLGALAAANTAGALGELPMRIAAQLDTIADVLNGGDDRAAAQATIEIPPGLPEAFDLKAHLRDALEAATMLDRRHPPRVHLLSKPRPGPYVQNHVDWLGRDALRFAAVMAIAMALGRHFAADRGYWIPLTAALVLKPDFQTTIVRGVARIGGTLEGAVVAGLVVPLVRAHPAWQLAGIIVAAGAAYVTFNPNYALFTVAITSFVVMVLGMRGLSGTTTVDRRVLDTLAGGALAMIGFLALPTWERKRTRALLADVLDAQSALAGAILRSFAPAGHSRKSVEAARTAVWRARTAAEASIDRTLHEPRRPHTIGAGRALRILAATQRFALENLALETALESQSPIGRVSLERFADELNAAMAELARALRAGRRARIGDGLANELTRLESTIDANDDFQRFIVERLRGYTEAVWRLARLVGADRTLDQA
jgi:uncharacterized membrane protein YccC